MASSTNLAGGQGLGPFRADPLGFMIRLSGESSAFIIGGGWQAYQNYIGVKIFYPEYTADMKKVVFGNPRLKELIKNLALEKQDRMSKLAKISRRKVPPLSTFETQVQENMMRILNGLAAEMSSMRTLKFVAFSINSILVRMFHQGIHVRESEFIELRRIALEAEKKKISLIFLPNHKSHMDYLVVSYVLYRMGIALPHIAAGENLNIPVVGSLLKKSGAFFIRRQWSGDEMYTGVVRAYIEALLLGGYNIEAFIEGTRSRIGKLLLPKYGILKIIMEAIFQGRVKDCIIVPMSIGYDKVIETGAYANELLGSPKEKESLSQLFSNLNLLGLKWGRIDVRFATPFTMSSFIESQSLNRPEEWNPSMVSDDFRALLQSLSYRVLSNINDVTVIMPTALVGTILITLRGNGVGEEEMIRKVAWLKKRIMKKKGQVADFGDMTTREVILRAAQVLRKDLVGYRTDLLETVYFPVNRFELSFYRNQIIHLFVSEAIISVAMYSTVKAGGPHSTQKIPFQKLESDTAFLSQLFKNEFVYGPGGLIHNLNETLKELEADEIIIISSGEEVGPKDTRWIQLSPKERKLGRETFDFFCFLLWPFVETYWLSAISLFTILPRKGSSNIRWVNEKDFLDRAQFFGKTLYYEGNLLMLYEAKNCTLLWDWNTPGDVSYLESVNKETLRNGIGRLKDLGVIFVSIGPEPPDNPLFSKNSSASASLEYTWIAVKEDWLPPLDAFPDVVLPSGVPMIAETRIRQSISFHGLFHDAPLHVGYSPTETGPYGNPRPSSPELLTPESPETFTTTPLVTDQVYDTVFARWSTFQPSGILWGLCERIGAFRREGKNRRDTATVANRVLRLAAVAGTWSDTMIRERQSFSQKPNAMTGQARL